MPRDIAALTSLGYGLEEAAIQILRKSTFRPAMKGGKPISLEIRIPVDFRLNDRESLDAIETDVTQEVQPPELLEYYPKKLAFLPEESIIFYFDKTPIDVSATFGDVTIAGNKVMINNITPGDRYKKPYTVKWKGGRVDLVFEHTDMLKLDSVGEED